jgi:hypothetical protein
VHPVHEAALGSQPRTVANNFKTSSHSNNIFGARRARREAEHLLVEIRTLLDKVDSGEIELDYTCCMIHRLGGRLAALALSGDLAA